MAFHNPLDVKTLQQTPQRALQLVQLFEFGGELLYHDR